MVTESGVEENMGLVVFGERANVVQNLTNDFNLIRDGIGMCVVPSCSLYVYLCKYV